MKFTWSKKADVTRRRESGKWKRVEIHLMEADRAMPRDSEWYIETILELIPHEDDDADEKSYRCIACHIGEKRKEFPAITQEIGEQEDAFTARALDHLTRVKAWCQDEYLEAILELKDLPEAWAIIKDGALNSPRFADPDRLPRFTLAT